MFKTPEQLAEFIKDASNNSSTMRMANARRRGVDACYYEGVQWTSVMFNPGTGGSSVIRLPVEWNPDAATHTIRAVDNITSRLTQKVASGTEPSDIYVEVYPSARDTGPESCETARTHEVLTNCLLEDCGYLGAWQRANFRRCIFGTWGILLYEEEAEDGIRMRANDFDPMNLILEPSCNNLDLHRHPYVIYQDTWTLDRIKRAFGIEIPPDQASTVAALEPLKIDIAHLSHKRLFSRYAHLSNAKAARVTQVHIRGRGDRFDEFYIAIQLANQEVKWLNDKSPVSPFGWTGLPMTLLHAYPRADTMWSWGEPAQLKDLQDKKNTTESQHQRMLRTFAGGKTIVDRRYFSGRPSDEDIVRRFTNQPNGVIVGEASDRARNVMPPSFVSTPPPPSYMMELQDRYDVKGRELVHRSAASFGDDVKTHTPNSTFMAAREDAGQVQAGRMRRDIMANEYLVKVLHATGCDLIRQQNIPTVAVARMDGFEDQDFATVLQTDPICPGVYMKIPEASIVNMSPERKKQNLDTALQLQAITPEDYRMGMAEFVQMPLTEQDRFMVSKCRRIAIDVIHGVEWQGAPMGQWNGTLIKELISAQFDQKTAKIQGALQRIGRAIQSQYQMQYQEQVMANPELAQKLMQGQQQQPEQEEPAGPTSMADALDSLSGNGPANAGGQTSAA